MELGDQPRLAALQLGQQQLPEQLVVAVPPVAAVHRHQELVRGGQRLQHLLGPADLEDRVAQGPESWSSTAVLGVVEAHGRLREARQQAGRGLAGDRVAVAGDRRPDLVPHALLRPS